MNEFGLGISANPSGSGFPQSALVVTPTSLRGIPQPLRLLVVAFLLVIPGCAFAQGGACPANWNSIDPNGTTVGVASYAGIKTCYYASKSIGSDTQYDGTQETVSGSHGPFAHIPGMSGCTGNCANVTPAAGEGFIMRGGDTWSGADLGVYWGWSGTGKSSQIYIGVDPNWFNSSTCGSSWCRPAWNFSGINANAFLADGASKYWWFDNVEIKALCNSENGVYVQGATNIRASQLYFHGWTHCTNSNNVGFFSQGGSGSMADHNVMDGSDSSKNTFNAFYSYWSSIQYNVIKYVVSGLIGSSDVVHDNFLSNTVTSADGDHCNGFFTFAPLSGNSQLIYNNVVDMGTGCPGGVQMWFNGNSGTNSSWVGYGFGNVIYNTSGGNLINVGNHGSGNYGTYYVFNNTVDCSNGGCGGTLPTGPYFTIYDQNNQVIGGSYLALEPPSGGTILACNDGSGSGCTDLSQGATTAAGQGYTSTSPAPYMPPSSCTSSTCLTLQAGTNLNSAACAGLSSINSDAYAACLKGSTGGPAYNQASHTISGPNVTPASRPSGKWDIGAYQAGSSSGPPAVTTLTGNLVTN